MKRDKFWGYIGGMIDGEGSVTKPTIRPSGALVITNSDREILEEIQKFLAKHKIKTQLVTRRTRARPCHKSAYLLQMYGWRNLKSILENCPILIREKRERLESVVRRGELKDRNKQERI